jgi:hypothetical protein
MQSQKETVNAAAGTVTASRLRAVKSLYPIHTVHQVVTYVFRYV